jgi:hypothetical protein
MTTQLILLAIRHRSYEYGGDGTTQTATHSNTSLYLSTRHTTSYYLLPFLYICFLWAVKLMEKYIHFNGYFKYLLMTPHFILWDKFEKHGEKCIKVLFRWVIRIGAHTLVE